MPRNAPLGSARLIVTTSAGASAPAALRVVPWGFGIRGAEGARRRITPERPARPHETVTLSGTGLGSGAAPRVWVGGQQARVLRQSAAGEWEEIVIEIPSAAPQGCAGGRRRVPASR